MTAAQQLEIYTLQHQGHSPLFSLSLPSKELFLLCLPLKGHTGNVRHCSVLTRPPQLQKRPGTQYCLLCNHTDPSSEDKQTKITTVNFNHSQTRLEVLRNRDASLLCYHGNRLLKTVPLNNNNKNPELHGALRKTLFWHYSIPLFYTASFINKTASLPKLESFLRQTGAAATEPISELLETNST